MRRAPRFEEGFSLAIASGRGGARLSHSHSRQYCYVLQSLHLWKEINEQMFRLWLLSEEDLLDPTRPYVQLCAPASVCQLRPTDRGCC